METFRSLRLFLHHARFHITYARLAVKHSGYYYKHKANTPRLTLDTIHAINTIQYNTIRFISFPQGFVFYYLDLTILDYRLVLKVVYNFVSKLNYAYI